MAERRQTGNTVPAGALRDVRLTLGLGSAGPQERPGPDNSNKGEPMAAEKSQNVQDVFLNHIRKGKIPVTVFLINGVKLQGIVSWFDNFCVLLRRDGQSQLVYKHAISTIMPAAPVQLYEQEDDAED